MENPKLKNVATIATIALGSLMFACLGTGCASVKINGLALNIPQDYPPLLPPDISTHLLVPMSINMTFDQKLPLLKPGAFQYRDPFTAEHRLTSLGIRAKAMANAMNEVTTPFMASTCLPGKPIIVTEVFPGPLMVDGQPAGGVTRYGEAEIDIDIDKAVNSLPYIEPTRKNNGMPPSFAQLTAEEEAEIMQLSHLAHEDAHALCVGEKVLSLSEFEKLGIPLFLDKGRKVKYFTVKGFYLFVQLDDDTFLKIGHFDELFADYRSVVDPELNPYIREMSKTYLKDTSPKVSFLYWIDPNGTLYKMLLEDKKTGDLQSFLDHIQLFSQQKIYNEMIKQGYDDATAREKAMSITENAIDIFKYSSTMSNTNEWFKKQFIKMGFSF